MVMVAYGYFQAITFQLQKYKHLSDKLLRKTRQNGDK